MVRDEEFKCGFTPTFKSTLEYMVKNTSRSERNNAARFINSEFKELQARNDALVKSIEETVSLIQHNEECDSVDEHSLLFPETKKPCNCVLKFLYKSLKENKEHLPNLESLPSSK